MIGIQVLRVGAVSIFSDGNIQQSILKVHGPAVVIGSAAQWIEIQHDYFTSCDDDITVGGETTDAIVCTRRYRVVKINEVVGSEIGIKRYADQSAFSTSVDAERNEWRW
jgi:hypothetical protein